jgi:DNA-binding CsgD family transcriptional regulator
MVTAEREVVMREIDRPLDLLEAAYRLDGSDQDWMGELTRTATKIFRRWTLGAVGSLVWGRIDDEGRTVIANITNGYVDTRALGFKSTAGKVGWLPIHAGLPPELQRTLYFSPSFADTASRLVGGGPAAHPFYRATRWDTSVVKDAMGLIGHDGTLNVAALVFGLPEETLLTPAERRLGERLATHVGTAFRLRCARRATLESADVVLTPGGKVEHLEPGTSREAVSVGFKQRKYARSRAASPEAALEVWQGLHDGRWSLVDYVDNDGKAFVLAVRNEPARDVASALTDRQRAAVALATLGYGNKQIGYALGLSATAAAMLLARARAATGLRTRAELVKAFRGSLAEPAGGAKPSRRARGSSS